MASDLEFVTWVVDQCDEDLAVTFKRMFGEFGLYSRGTFIGVICDNRLFLKPTGGGRTFLGERVDEAPAYPGAKPSFRIGDRIDDRAWLSELVRITARELTDAAG
ncbi:MAG: TfoX/Sxy family protein [Gemmatimonadota bacterium]|jgi:TfoX/Sxy family transcriptional regulator of competence genes